MNQLFYGDNLDVLRRHINDESVDLVYLDPPFNSNADYNVLFKQHSGVRAAAQVRVFEDTWRWDQCAAEAYEEIVEQGGSVSAVMQAFRSFVGESDMLAYLAMMAPRLVELRRALKPTGSLFLHCDPTASHYLKLLLDAVFGFDNFRNEIIWRRTSSHNDARKRFGDATDAILFYSKTANYTFNRQFARYSDSYIASHYRTVDGNGRPYTTRDLRSPGPRPNLTYDYKGYKPHANGWSISIDKMREYDAAGLLHFPASKTGRIRLKRFLDEMPGTPIGSVWDDIEALNSQAAERLGYPTQKPEALLERIISAGSNPGDVVLDPFCGCGTSIAAAQKLGRGWIGIDVTHLAINLIRNRLKDSHGDSVQFKVLGEPTTLEDAQELARTDPYQFQWWALGLVGARPAEQKKGADRGIDGRLYFHDEKVRGNTKQVVLSVKAGHASVPHVRDLVGVLSREKAEIGVLISLQTPTSAMRKEANSSGFYTSSWGRHPRVQLLTIADLLSGHRIDYPRTAGSNITLKKAPRWRKKVAQQLELGQEEEAPIPVTRSIRTAAKKAVAKRPLKAAAKTSSKKKSKAG